MVLTEFLRIGVDSSNLIRPGYSTGFLNTFKAMTNWWMNPLHPRSGILDNILVEVISF